MGTLITRDGCELDYRTAGDGPDTLVLLHGWSQSGAMFDRLVPHLAGSLRVVTYDMRNHGESGRSDNGHRVASLAADLRELLDHLGIARAHLLGHSMGSSVLWSFIDQYGTGRLRSLVVLDQPSVCVSMPWMTAEEGPQAGAILDFPGTEGFVAALLGPDSETVRRSFLVSMLTPDIPAADLDWLYAENLKMALPFGAKLLNDHAMQDWRDVLPRIDVPTLVVGGEVSHVAPGSQEWSAKQIPGAELRIFTRAEGGAHFPFFESPDTFAPVLLDFLRRAS